MAEDRVLHSLTLNLGPHLITDGLRMYLHLLPFLIECDCLERIFRAIFQHSMPNIYCIVLYNASPIPTQYKYKYNYTNPVRIYLAFSLGQRTAN